MRAASYIAFAAAAAGQFAPPLAAARVYETPDNFFRARDAPDPVQAPENAWRAEFDAFGWLLGMDGTVGVRGRSGSVHATFLDIVDSTDSLFGFTGRLEVGRGPFALYLDGTYDEAGVDNATDPAGLSAVDITFTETVLDFGAMYRVVQASGPRDADIDLYAGGRYLALSLELDPLRLPKVSSDRSWTDPVVGAKLRLPLDGRFRLALNGDIGGFGAASNFTWSATALVALDFMLRDAPASVMFGYRAIGWNYAEGAGTSRFTWDVIQHGVIVGFGLRF